MTDRAHCATAARRRGDPLVATASRVSRWLLVEQPGAWGPPALPTSRMQPSLAEAVVAAGLRSTARVLLIRRPGRASGDARAVFVADTRPGVERVRQTVVAAEADLQAVLGVLPWDEEVGGWDEPPDPLLLVCTHGRHDVCCALRGRPVARALAAQRPAQTWECSHVGGDRFAANLLELPSGRCFGNVSPLESLAVADALAAGRVPVAHLRGRGSLPSPVQAAEHFARASLGREDAADLGLLSQAAAGADRWRVVLGGGDGPDVEVVVSYDRDVAPALLTCGAIEAKAAPVFRLLSLTELPALDKPSG